LEEVELVVLTLVVIMVEEELIQYLHIMVVALLLPLVVEVVEAHLRDQEVQVLVHMEEAQEVLEQETHLQLVHLKEILEVIQVIQLMQVEVVEQVLQEQLDQVLVVGLVELEQLHQLQIHL
jgi:hypothetical protein